MVCPGRFQSTLSLRRATGGTERWKYDRLFQSTLSLRRATGARAVRPVVYLISIHALLAESDLAIDDQWDLHLVFQSTLSLRRATSLTVGLGKRGANFNPRSPCGERQCRYCKRNLVCNFNPRSPCGERRWTANPERGISNNFNPRSPCGERQQIPPNWPYRFCLKCQFKDGEKSKKAKGSASAQASSPAYEKNKVRIPWGDFECFRFAPIK